jgi:hypothetical protein
MTILMNDAAWGIAELSDGTIVEADTGALLVPSLLPAATWQTPVRGTNDQEYQIYLACADNGKGGDITRGGAPLKSYDEWLAS